QAGVNDLDLVAHGAKEVFGLHALFKQLDEMAVDLDGIEAVVPAHASGDLDGDGAAAGADFEDTRRRSRTFEMFDERAGQEATAGQDGPRRAEVVSTDPKEFAALKPGVHPRSLACVQLTGGVGVAP